MNKTFAHFGVLLILLSLTQFCPAQTPPPGTPPPRDPGFGPPPSLDEPPPGERGGPGRRGPFGGPGGPGGIREDRKIVTQFDKNNDKRLDTSERQAAREFLAKERTNARTENRGPSGGDAGRPPGGPGDGPGFRAPDEGRGPGGGGGFRGPDGEFRGPDGGRRGPRGFGPRENQPPASPGRKVSMTEIKSFPGAPLYASNVLRTFFLEFENAEWEKELSDFNNTDVEVPAKLTVDGKVYPEVGVHFRGSSSYMMVGEGRKRSFNLSVDFVNEDQRLLGYRTLNLLNSHRDPTFLRTVLYSHIARHYLPAPHANHVHLVVNGESWGIYVNTAQFNKDFTKEWFGETKGARWKVPGSPRGNAGLSYLGEEPAPYKRKYEIKSKDDPKAWSALIQLCRTLSQTPPEKLEAALEPLLDVEQVLRFLAIENVFINSDGYWTRASDYDLYLDGKGRFHVIPYDANETFNAPEGGGRRGGEQQVRGVELDPLAGSDDPNKPLLHRLLAVPALEARYLALVREIAIEWLDWKKLGPIATEYQSLIAEEVKLDTRKLSTFEAFQRGLGEATDPQNVRGPERMLSLKSFADQRRAYLLSDRKAKTTEAVQE